MLNLMHFSHIVPLITILCGFLPLPAAEKPNILFLFSDDHALQAITAYGNSRYAAHFQPPNLDRLAKEGALFVNSFCGPSRACVLTGKHSVRNGFVDACLSELPGHQTTGYLIQTLTKGK
jgi:N-acetylglucosamine-6-sulfatase